jgi:hypothetical protein
MTVVAVLLCAACSHGNLPEPAVKPDMAQIRLRHIGNFLPISGPAVIEANGTEVAKLNVKETYVGDLPAGPVQLTVHSMLIPGTYAIAFTAERGAIYRFNISLRGESAGELSQNFSRVKTGGIFQIGPGY